ncbi:MAG: 1-acyl-sn-glycerol-3-phosphate acyltransferase [Beijerinckiaceae bacterium]|jgi:1-acyl-sn-glycerol-3-phosphate acyltransferase|nr:1-acyl-sn-glycerol-3-phosphate acyltransferase [Beijerinckiaceae bacterium]
MLLLRSILFNALFYANMIALMIVGLPTLFMARSAVFKLARIWARSSLWLLDKTCGLGVEFRGVERLPPAPYIIAPKHQSTWETFALTLVFEDFSYILKRELTFIPVFGWYLWKADQIAINRSKGKTALAQAATRAQQIFSDGRLLFIFPEGTRRPAGAPAKYKFGVAHLYETCAVPCVPVALNSGLFWARRSWIRRPGTIVVEVLDPIAPGLEKQAFFELLQERLETASDRLIAEAVARNPSLASIVQSNRNS